MTPAPQRRAVSQVSGRLATYNLGRFVLGGLLWLPVSVIPLASGLLLKAVFDRLTGDELTGPIWLCAAFVGVELVRGLIMIVAWSYGVYWWNASAVVLRSNVLRSLFTARGAAAGRLPSTSGEAVGRLRDDVAELVDFVDTFITLTGAVLFAVGALVVMVSIDWRITLVLILPMLAIGVLSPLVGARVERLHERAQAEGATVTGFVGELFGGVLAIKTAGATEAALARLAVHNRRRRDAVVRDRLAADLLGSATSATVEISVGLVLLLAAASMRRGDFTVGDLALFTTYISWLTGLPRTVGSVLFQLPRAAVSVNRLRRLLPEEETGAGALVRDTRVWFRAEPPALAGVPREVEPLRTLTASGLTVSYEGGRGIHDVSLRIERGSFTVVTGPIGSGKSTLLRALLGLEPIDAGAVCWNDTPVADPGTFLVPGRAAYAGQVPRLFSASMRDNLLLGLPGGELERAVHLAALEPDLAAMIDGLQTVVGPRGARLSGGQVQRAVAARALVRMPELLVLDDLSSALDVETEHLLWSRLADASRDGTGPATLLVVSHRRAALRRADHIVVLDGGRVVGEGALAELLDKSPQMRRLWADED